MAFHARTGTENQLGSWYVIPAAIMSSTSVRRERPTRIIASSNRIWASRGRGLAARNALTLPPYLARPPAIRRPTPSLSAVMMERLGSVDI
jgi:hypothetical protein